MLTEVQCSWSGVSDTDQSASEDAKIMEWRIFSARALQPLEYEASTFDTNTLGS